MRRGGYAAALLSGAVLFLAVWVTSTETVNLLPQSGPPASAPTSAPPTGANHRQHRGFDLPDYHPPTRQVGTEALDIAAYVLLGAVALALLAFLFSAFLHRDRRPPRVPQREPEFSTDGAMAALDVPQDLVEAAERQLVALREGSPRNAIVACWMELEGTCRERGFPRGRAETSTEFTARVLSRYTVGARTVGALAALYREARFSEHQLTEADRQRAFSALEEILASLQQSQRQDPNTVTTG